MMPGPAPKPNRRRRNKPARGEFHSADGIGWQHGEPPQPPDGLVAESVRAWYLWFGAWWAANWGPEDVPVLRQVIRLYDDIERHNTTKATDRSQLHVWMRSYGITPDGQLANRWARPPEEAQSSKPDGQAANQPAAADHYAHLRVVNE